MRKGVVTKGRFRPNNVSLRTFSGPVLLHRSSVNRFELQTALKFIHSRRLFHIHSVNVNILFSFCRGKSELPSRWLTFFSAVKSSGNVFIRDSSVIHPLTLLLLTDCDITERGRVSAQGEKSRCFLKSITVRGKSFAVRCWGPEW